MHRWRCRCSRARHAWLGRGDTCAGVCVQSAGATTASTAWWSQESTTSRRSAVWGMAWPEGDAAGTGAAPQLAADGAGAAALKAGYGPEAPALLAQRCQRHSVFWLQVFVSRSHLRTLPSVRVLHFRFETARLRRLQKIGDTPCSTTMRENHCI